MLRVRGVNAESQYDDSPEYAAQVFTILKGYGLTDRVIALRLGMTRRQIINIRNDGFKKFTTQMAFERLAGMR